MRPLRLFYLYKGEQNLNIGDSIKSVISDFCNDDYYLLDWNFTFEQLEEIVNSIKIDINSIKSRGPERIININLYFVNSKNIIVGILPINHKKHISYSKPDIKRPPNITLDDNDELKFSKLEFESFIKENKLDSFIDNDVITVLNRCIINPTNDYKDGFKDGVNFILNELLKLERGEKNE